MKFIVEPKKVEELAFCNGCSSNACIDYTNNSGNTSVKVTVKV